MVGVGCVVDFLIVDFYFGWCWIGEFGCEEIV